MKADRAKADRRTRRMETRRPTSRSGVRAARRAVGERTSGDRRATRRSGESARRSRRAQTTIDFAIGAGIFLLAIAFIFSFVPGMFQPFTGGQERPLAADRAANRLTTDVLGTPDRPYVLDRECTESFFRDADAPTGCRYDETGADSADLRETLGLTDRLSINVTVENETGVVDLGGGPLVAGTPLSVGGSAVASNGVVVARRTVSIDGEPCRLYVRVW